MSEEEVRKLKAWIEPKKVQIRLIEKTIEAQKLYDKQLVEDIESGFLINQKKKEIAEQMTDGARKLKTLELEMLEKELDAKFTIRQSAIIMEDLQVKLLMEQNALKDIEKKIVLVGRNHKVLPSEEKKDE